MYYRRVVCLSVAASGRGRQRGRSTTRVDESPPHVDVFFLIYARLTLTLSGRNTRLLAIL